MRAGMRGLSTVPSMTVRSHGNHFGRGDGQFVVSGQRREEEDLSNLPPKNHGRHIRSQMKRTENSPPSTF